MLNDSIDKIVKDKLSGFEKEPPEYIWSAINQRMLDARRRRRVLFYWRSAAAVAVLLLSVGIVYFITGGKVRENNVALVDQSMEKKGISEGVSLPESENEKRSATEAVVFSDDKNVVHIASNEEKKVSTVPDKSGSAGAGRKNKAENRSHTVPALMAVPGHDGSGESAVNAKTSTGKVEAAEDLNLRRPAGIRFFAGSSGTPAATLIVPADKKKKVTPLYAYTPGTVTYREKNRKLKFILGGSVSPMYNYRNLNDAQSSPVVYSPYEVPGNETGIISVSGGLNLRMEGKSRWSFETGVLYSQVGQEVSQNENRPVYASVSEMYSSSSYNLKNVSSSVMPRMVNSLGEIRFNNNTTLGLENNLRKSGVYLATPSDVYDYQPGSSTLKQLLDYIEIPFMARYALLNSKAVISLAGGFSTNFLIGNAVYVTESGESVYAGKTEGIYNVTYSSTVGIGVELPIGRSFRFSLEPRFKYFLRPVNSMGMYEFHPYSIGVFGGISFIFDNH